MPRGDGSAEFAISVATNRRGGLGSILLAHLRAAAASRGLDSLYGDVLPDNEPMLRLLRRLGGVTIHRHGREFVSVLVGSATPAPPWPDNGGQPRVLVEAASGRWAGEDELRAAGMQVAVCLGPAARTGADSCPLLVRDSCPLVAEADAIVHLLPADTAGRHIRAAVRESAKQGTPVLTPRDSDTWSATVERIVTEVRRDPAAAGPVAPGTSGT